MVADFAFPLIFIGILGTSLQAGFGDRAGGLNLLDYVFTGVLAQTVWQSSAPGLISLLAPMRYAVDLIRDAYYGSTSPVVLSSATTNLLIIGALFVVFMVLGTFLFVRAERNR